MAEGEEHHREVETEFVAHDKSSGALERIAEATERVNKLAEKGTDLLMDLGGAAKIFAGGLGITKMFEKADEHLEMLARIKATTGMAAENADALVEAMSDARIPTQEAANIITTMSRKGSQLEMLMGRMSGNVGTMGRSFKQMGVDLSKGPQAAILQMAKGVEKGKITMGDLMARFRLAPKTAEDMMRLLEKGPEKLKETLKEFKDRKIGVTDEDLENFEKFKDAQSTISSAWDRLQIVVGVRLFPVISKVMDYVSEHLKDWVTYARTFAGVLSDFFDNFGPMILMVGKGLAVNAGLQKFTGKGLIDHGMEMAEKAKHLWKSTQGVAAEKGTAMGLWNFMTGATKLFGKASLLVAAAAAMEAIAKNVDGVADRIQNAFDMVYVSLKPLLSIFGFETEGSIGKLWEQFGAYVAHTFANIFEGLAQIFVLARGFYLFAVKAIDAIQRLYAGGKGGFSQGYSDAREGGGGMLKGVVNGIRASVFEVGQAADKISNPLDMFTDSMLEADNEFKRELAKYKEAKKAAERGEAKDKAQKGNVVFNNNRFDITQKFAEGFDPDRIAVAFTNDLAELGERRASSALQPAFTGF